ncbi:hypothetical protein BRD08_11285 [Halobacteriales archaeon SW_10_66_29]|nr:MAG: hypothetical protein BRD08_11285 [Halobacteriales archaeon SW_10_66_29]
MSERTAAFVARSGARSAVLRAVAAEGRPGEELVSTLDLSKSGVYKAINELAERDLIAQNGTAWTATALGRLVVDELDRHRRLDALLDHGEYWLTHDLSVLPDRFRRRMPELGAVDVMRNPDNDPRYLERYWTEQMPGYEQLWVGSRIFHWEYGEAMDEQARAEASTGKAIRSGEAGQPDGARDRTGHRGDETDERGRPEGATRLLSHAPLVEENPEGVAEYLERRPDAVVPLRPRRALTRRESVSSGRRQVASWMAPLGAGGGHSQSRRPLPVMVRRRLPRDSDVYRRDVSGALPSSSAHQVAGSAATPGCQSSP